MNYPRTDSGADAEHYQRVCARQSFEIEALRREKARLFNALYRIVRQNAQRHPIGHDAIVAARSAIRRSDPALYAKIVQLEKP